MLFQLIKAATLPKHISSSSDGLIYMHRFMRLVGWIPLEHISWFSKILLVLSFTFGGAYLPLAFFTSYIVHIGEFTTSEFLSSLMTFFNAVSSSIKAIILYSLLWRIHKAMKLLDMLDARCVLESEKLAVRRAVAGSNRIFLMFSVAYQGFVGLAFFSSVFMKHPPWQVYNPFFDWRYSTLYFWTQSILEYLIVACAVVQNQLSDTYALLLIYIIRAHFDLLRGRIERLRRLLDRNCEEQHEELVRCILDHKLILEYCDLIRPIISGTIFTQFIFCGILLGLSLLHIVFFADLWSGVSSGVYMFDILLQTFPFCYICDLLVDDSEMLSRAIFHSNWLGSDLRYKKTMIQFIHNVQKPIVFMAMGIFQVSLRTNLVLAKFAFSVITIVNQMNIAERFK